MTTSTMSKHQEALDGLVTGLSATPDDLEILSECLSWGNCWERCTDPRWPWAAGLGPATAVAAWLVRARGDAGWTVAELAAALARSGNRSDRLDERLDSAITKAARQGKIDQVMEYTAHSPAGGQCFLLPVKVFIPARLVAAKSLFGGFQHPDTPRGFHGHIPVERVSPATAATFLTQVRGPILRDPIAVGLQQRAASSADVRGQFARNALPTLRGRRCSRG